MKKIITIAVLLVSFTIQSQIYISGAVDVKNALSGSTATQGKNALDGMLTAHIVGGNIEVAVSYEKFKAIGFEKYSIGLGAILNKEGWFTYGARVEINQILRNSTVLNSGWGNNSSHLALGAVFSVKFNVSDCVSIGLQTSLLQRTDLKTRYQELYTSAPIVASNYVTVFIKVFDPKKIK
jgi:hypothetical protein